MKLRPFDTALPAHDKDSVTLEKTSPFGILGWSVEGGELPRDAVGPDKKLYGATDGNIKAQDDTRVIDGHEFKCQKLTFSVRPKFAEIDWNCTLWLSEEVKCGGLVAAELTGFETKGGEKIAIKTSINVVRFGSGKVEEWAAKRKPSGDE